MFKTMIILTGHKGYIGHHIYKRYPNALVLDEARSFEAWEKKLNNISNAISEDATIVHCGAISDIKYQTPDIFKWNYEATKRIADLALDKKAHLIFISSCAAISPNSFYGWSKRCAEDYIQAKLGLDHTILRLYNVFGEEQRRAPDKMSVPEKLKRHTLEYVFNPFERDYIHVSDVVQAVVFVQENRITGKYDVGTGRAVKIIDLAKLEDCGFWKETTAEAIFGKHHPSLKLCARKDHLLKGWEAKEDISKHKFRNSEER